MSNPLVAELPTGVAPGRRLHRPGEGEGEVGVQVDDTADVVVELPDEADVAAKVVGDHCLMVLVDLIDQ